MRIVIFCHSLISDWNHGNAHFLRGVIGELLALGHRVDVYEPGDAWSVRGLVAEAGQDAVQAFHYRYPHLKSIRYEFEQLDLEKTLEGVDLVLVHEWNEPRLIGRIGQLRRQLPPMVALFHDTHHRAVSDLSAIAALDLRDYDGALVFGRSLAELYKHRALIGHIWVWHEAADTRLFYPRSAAALDYDLVWIGNWGDDERSAELRKYLVQPARRLSLRAAAYGVRYPAAARQELSAAGIEHRGWLPNFNVPSVLAATRTTVHVHRTPYIRYLPGIPTIRVFEALACGTPLLCAPWEDVEGLFEPGAFQVAANASDMERKLRIVLNDQEVAKAMVESGLRSIRQHHTCAHRAAELVNIYNELRPHRASSPAVPNLPGSDSEDKERSSRI